MQRCLHQRNTKLTQYCSGFLSVFLSCCLLCSQSAGDEPIKLKPPLGLKPIKVPKDNPITKEKIELGRRLFFDKRLSKNETVSCASCHDPAKGWSNGTAVAEGIEKQTGNRNSPTLINVVYSRSHFWDGRAKTLEEQALGPIQNPIEMGMDLKELEERLGKIESYKQEFKSVFDTEVTSDSIAKAIATFERTILSGDAPYDKFKAGDESALTESAARGRKLFFGKANCSACHSGSNFTDNGFHNIGIGMEEVETEQAPADEKESKDKKSPEKDLGRFVLSKLGGDKGAFKTPTLREIARTAPYMHDGRFQTLEEVIEYYDKGGIANPQLDEELFPLKLNDQQKNDLITFLKEGLASENYPQETPAKAQEK